MGPAALRPATPERWGPGEDVGLGVAAPGSVGRREQAGERWAVCVFLTPRPRASRRGWEGRDVRAHDPVTWSPRPPGPSSLLCDVGWRNRESLGKK